MKAVEKTENLLTELKPTIFIFDIEETHNLILEFLYANFISKENYANLIFCSSL
jgi:hypothetical protein